MTLLAPPPAGSTPDPAPLHFVWCGRCHEHYAHKTLRICPACDDRHQLLPFDC